MFGVVPTDDDGRVVAFIEKPPRDEAPTNRINAGTYVLEPSVLDRIAGDRRGVHRAGGLSRDGGRGPSVRARRPTTTGSTPARRSNTCKANLDLLGGRVPSGGRASAPTR